MRARTSLLWFLFAFAPDAAQAADEAAPDPGAPDKIQEAQALLEQANGHRDHGRLEEAVAAYERALELLEAGGAGNESIAAALKKHARGVSS
jgi:hypothetical protein